MPNSRRSKDGSVERENAALSQVPIEDVLVSDDDDNEEKQVATADKPLDMTPPDVLLEKARARIRNHVRNQRIDKCIEEMCRCIALTRIVFGDDSWLYAQAYAHLAETYLDFKGNTFAPQACQYAEMARNIMQKLVATRENIISFAKKVRRTEREEFTRTVFSIYFVLGKCYTLQKKLKEAEACLRKAETILDNELDAGNDADVDDDEDDDEASSAGSDEERSKKREKRKKKKASDSKPERDEIDDLKIALNTAFGRLFGKQKQEANAVLHYEKALHLAKKRHGSDSVLLIPIYTALGTLEQNRSDFQNHAVAVEWFVKAHDITEKNYERGSIELADSARALATAYSLTNNAAAEANAESFLEEHVALLQGAHGTHHPKALELQEDLARLYVRTGRAQQAIELLRNVARLKKITFGEYHAKLSETYRLLGSVYLKQGDVKNAVSFFEKALKIDEIVLGKSHKTTKETAETLEFLSKQQKQGEADKKPFVSTVRPARTPSAMSTTK